MLYFFIYIMLYYKENNLLVNYNNIRNKFIKIILFCNNYEQIIFLYTHLYYSYLIF